MVNFFVFPGKQKEEPQTLAKKLLSKALGNVSKGDSTPLVSAEESSSGETPTCSPMQGKLKFSMRPVTTKVQKVSFTLKPKKNALKKEEEEEEEGAKPEGSVAEEPTQPARFNFKKSKGDLFRPDQEPAVEMFLPKPLLQSALVIQAAALLQQERAAGLLELGSKKSPSIEDRSERRRREDEDKESRRRRRDEDKDSRQRRGRDRDEREKRSRDDDRRSRRSQEKESKDDGEKRKDTKSTGEEETKGTDADKASEGDKNISCNKEQNSKEKEGKDEGKMSDNTSDVSADDKAAAPKSHGLAEISKLYTEDEEDTDKSEEPKQTVSTDKAVDSGVAKDGTCSDIKEDTEKDPKEVEETAGQSTDKHKKSETDRKESEEGKDKSTDSQSTSVEKEAVEDTAESKKESSSEPNGSGSTENTDGSKTKTQPRSRSDSREHGDKKKEHRSRSQSHEKDRNRSGRRHRSRSDSRDRMRERRNRRRSRSDSRERGRDRRGRDRSRSRERNRRRRSGSRDRDSRKGRYSRSDSRDRSRKQQHRDRSRSRDHSSKRRRRSRSRSRTKDTKRKEGRSRSKSRDKDRGKQRSSSKKDVEKDETRAKSDRLEGMDTTTVGDSQKREDSGRSWSSETTEFPITEPKERSRRSWSAETTEFPIAENKGDSSSVKQEISATSDPELLSTSVGKGMVKDSEENQEPGTVADETEAAEKESSSPDREKRSKQKDESASLDKEGTPKPDERSDSVEKEIQRRQKDRSVSVDGDCNSGQQSVSVEKEATSKGKGRSDSMDKETRSRKKDKSDSMDKETSFGKKDRSDSMDKETRSRKKDRSDSKDKETRSRKKDRSDSRDKETRSRKKDRSHSRDKETRSRKKDRSDSRDKETRSRKKDRSHSMDKETRSRKKDRSHSRDKETRSRKKDRSDSREREGNQRDKSLRKRNEKRTERESGSSKSLTDQTEASRKGRDSGSPSRKGWRHKGDHAEQDSDSDNERNARRRVRSPERKPHVRQRQSSSEDSVERIGGRRRSRSRSYDRLLSRRLREEDRDSEEEMFRRHAKDWSRDQARRHYKRRHKMANGSDEEEAPCRSSSKSSTKEDGRMERSADSRDKETRKSSSPGADALLFDLKDVLLPGEALPPPPESKKDSFFTKASVGSKSKEADGSDMDLDESDNEACQIELLPKAEHNQPVSEGADSGKLSSKPGDVPKKTRDKEPTQEKKKPEKISFSLKSSGKGKEMKLKLKSRHTTEELDDDPSEDKSTKLFLPQEADKLDEVTAALDSVVNKIRIKLEGSRSEPETTRQPGGDKERPERQQKSEVDEDSDSGEHHGRKKSRKGKKTTHDGETKEENLPETVGVSEVYSRVESIESEPRTKEGSEDIGKQKEEEEDKPADDAVSEEAKPRSGLFHFKSIPLWELDKDDEKDSLSRTASVVQIWGSTPQSQPSQERTFPLSLGLDYGSSSEEESEGGLKKIPLKGSRSPRPSKPADKQQEEPQPKPSSEMSLSIEDSGISDAPVSKKATRTFGSRWDNAREETTPKRNSGRSDYREIERSLDELDRESHGLDETSTTLTSKSDVTDRDRSSKDVPSNLEGHEETILGRLSLKSTSGDRGRGSRNSQSKWDSPGETTPKKHSKRSNSCDGERPSKPSDADEICSRVKSRLPSSGERERSPDDSLLTRIDLEEASLRKDSKRSERHSKDIPSESEEPSALKPSSEPSSRDKERSTEDAHPRRDDPENNSPRRHTTGSDSSDRERDLKDVPTDSNEETVPKKKKSSSRDRERSPDTVQSRQDESEETTARKHSRWSDSGDRDRGVKNVPSDPEETSRKESEKCTSRDAKAALSRWEESEETTSRKRCSSSSSLEREAPSSSSKCYHQVEPSSTRSTSSGESDRSFMDAFAKSEHSEECRQKSEDREEIKPEPSHSGKESDKLDQHHEAEQPEKTVSLSQVTLSDSVGCASGEEGFTIPVSESIAESGLYSPSALSSADDDEPQQPERDMKESAKSSATERHSSGVKAPMDREQSVGEMEVTPVLAASSVDQYTPGDSHHEMIHVSSTMPAGSVEGHDHKSVPLADSEMAEKSADGTEEKFALETSAGDKPDQAQQESRVGAAGSSISSASPKPGTRGGEKAVDLASPVKAESPHPHLTQAATSPRARTGRFGTASWSGSTKRRGLRPPIETIVAVRSKPSSSPGAPPSSTVPKPGPVPPELSFKRSPSSSESQAASPSAPVPVSSVCTPPAQVMASEPVVSCNTSQSSGRQMPGRPCTPFSTLGTAKVGKIQILLGRKVAPLQESPLAAASQDSGPPAAAPEVTIGFPVMVLTGTRKAEEPEPSELIWPECRAVAAREPEKEEEESSGEEESSSEEEDTDDSLSDRESSSRKDSGSSRRDERRDSSRRESDSRRRDSRDRDGRRRRDDTHSRNRRDDSSDHRRRYDDDDRRRRRDDDDRRRRDEEDARRRREKERERERERDRERERERALERERRERERERERQREIEREREEERRRRRRSSRSRSRDRSRDRSRSPDRRRPRDRERERDRARDRSPVSPDRVTDWNRDRLPDYRRSRSPDRSRPRSPDRFRDRSPGYARDRGRGGYDENRGRGQSPERSPRDGSPGRERTPPRDRDRNRDFSREGASDRSREKSSGRAGESPRLRSPGRFDDGQQRFLDRCRDSSPGRSVDRPHSRSPDRRREDSIDRYRDLSRDRGQFGRGGSRSPSQEREKDPSWLKVVDVKPGATCEAGGAQSFGLQTTDPHSVPPPPPPDFFHPSVSDQSTQPPPQDPPFVAQHPPHAGQTVGPYPEGYVDPQAAWQAGGAYPPQVDPATLQMVQHQYQAMGYTLDQALTMATQYLATATAAQLQDAHPAPAPAPAVHDPSTFPVDPAQQMYTGCDPAYQGHFPPGQPHAGYVHGHPPTADYSQHPAHAPYMPEACAPGYAPPAPAEAQFPYERFAEMEAHLRAEMHPDLREAALFGDLPSSRRPKGTKRQREAALRKDLAPREEPAAVQAKESSSSEVGKASEPTFETSTNSEPDFDFETSSLAEPEEGQLATTKRAPKPKPRKAESSVQKEGEDVVSSTNSAEIADLLKDEESSDSEFRPLKVKSRWRRNSEAEATSSTPPSPFSKRLLRESQEPALQEPENANQVEEAQVKEEPAVQSPPPRKRMRLEAEADQQEKEDVDSDFPVFEVITENIHLTQRYVLSPL